MLPEPEDEGPPYTGSFVVLRPIGLEYVVTVEPPLAGRPTPPRTYADKHSAWGAARDLWTGLKLPLRDFTVAQTWRSIEEK